MRIVPNPRTTATTPCGILFGAIALVGLAAARFLPVREFTPSCAFRHFLGFPCPTCGATRAAVSLAQGDLLGALRFNPLVAIAAVLLLLWGLFSAAAKVGIVSRRRFLLSDREKDLARFAAVSLVLANWLFLIAAL
jgi:hypothetical protein